MRKLLFALLALSASMFAQTVCVNCGGGVSSITSAGGLTTITEPLVIPSANSTANIAITGNTTSGLAMDFSGSGPRIWSVAAGVRRGFVLDASSVGIVLGGSFNIGWTSNSTDPGLAGADTLLNRDAAGFMALKGASNAVAGFRVYAGNGAYIEYGTASELLTLSTGGTTTDTTANLLPANSIIDAVDARVTTTITTATDWKLGDATIAGRFSAANATMTSGTTQVGTVQADQTGTSGPRQVAAAKVRVTTTGTPGAGVIRITVHYHALVPPTS